jgi:PAS domain S-box-containing protein
MQPLTRLRALTQAPAFEDDRENAAAALLNTSCWLTIAGAVSYQVLQISAGADWVRVSAVGVVGLLAAAALWLLRRGLLRAAGLLVTSTIFLIACLSLWIEGGTQSPGMVTLMILLIMSAMTLEPWPTIAWAALSVVTLTGFSIAESRGWLPPQSQRPILESWFIYAFHLAAATWLVTYSAGAVRGLLGTLGTRTSELVDSEERYAQLVEQSPDVIVAIESDGTIAECSPAIESLFGYRPEEVIGRAFRDLGSIHHDSFEQNLSSFRSLMAGERATLTATRVVHRDGSVHWVEANPRVVQREDGSARLHLVIREITERVEAEARRHELERRLAEAVRLEALGRLAGGLAHDFNNLLLVILSNLELLESERELDTRPLLRDMRVAGQAAADLTSQLLSFAGQQVREGETADVGTSFSRIEGLLRRLIPSNVTLELQIGDQLPAVACDPAQLERVIVNLVMNAQQVMPEGGRVTLEASSVHVEQVDRERYPGASPGEHVRISVSDSGPGIDEANLQRIFEPFFSDRPGGTGLGLATVHGTVSQSGGHLRVHSRPGEGARFEAFFPCTRRKAPGDATVSTAQPTSSPWATVLLVDDEPAVLSSVARLLERRGLRVLRADSADTARSASAAEPAGIDVLISDVMMPDTTGPKLARELLAVHPRMQVLLMSGYAKDHLVDSEVLRGALHFISKPFSGAALARKIEEILSDGNGNASAGGGRGRATTQGFAAT